MPLQLQATPVVVIRTTPGPGQRSMNLHSVLPDSAADGRVKRRLDLLQGRVGSILSGKWEFGLLEAVLESIVPELKLVDELLAGCSAKAAPDSPPFPGNTVWRLV